VFIFFEYYLFIDWLDCDCSCAAPWPFSGCESLQVYAREPLETIIFVLSLRSKAVLYLKGNARISQCVKSGRSQTILPEKRRPFYDYENRTGPEKISLYS